MKEIKTGAHHYADKGLIRKEIYLSKTAIERYKRKARKYKWTWREFMTYWLTKHAPK